MQRRRTSCSTGRGRRNNPAPGPPPPGTSTFPRRAGTPPCSRWCRSPAPGRRWPSSATRSPRPPPARPCQTASPSPDREPVPDREPSPAHEPPLAHEPPPGQGLRLDHAQRRVWTDGHEIQLTFQEFELLALPRRAPGHGVHPGRTSRAGLAPHPGSGRPAGAAGQPHRGRAREPGPAQARPALRPVPGHRVPRRVPVPPAGLRSGNHRRRTARNTSCGTLACSSKGVLRGR